MTIRLYSSTDTGSPGPINNVAGQMLGVLDVLVNGYALGTVSSITRSGSTATLTFSAAHNLLSKGNRITIAGCDQTEYNGEFLVAVPDTTTVTFTVTGTPATPATGTITASKAGSGWTKPYTGTNLAAYKQGTGSNGFYMYVDDTGTTAARAVGYETMTSISDTTGAAFPTTAQFAGGLYLPKSNGATARTWYMVATETYVYMWVDYTGTLTSAPMWFFGDFVSRKVADVFNTLFCAGTSAAFATYNGPAWTTTALALALAGNYITRTAAQTGTSVTAARVANSILQDAFAVLGSAGLPYPSLDGNLVLSEAFISEVVIKDIRGTMPGFLGPLHLRPLAHLDTFAGSGSYAGKVYLALTTFSSGQVFIQVE